MVSAIADESRGMHISALPSSVTEYKNVIAGLFPAWDPWGQGRGVEVFYQNANEIGIGERHDQMSADRNSFGRGPN